MPAPLICVVVAAIAVGVTVKARSEHGFDIVNASLVGALVLTAAALIVAGRLRQRGR